MVEPLAEGLIDAHVDSVRRLVGAASAPPARRAAPAPQLESPPGLAPFLDHTLLKTEATVESVLQLAREARTHRFAGACVNPWHVARVARALEGSGVLTVAVVGFPLGATSAALKAAEAARARGEGADELDTVLNVGALKSGLLDEALADLRAVVEATSGAPVKVILETHLLTPHECVTACVLAELAGAAFVKTSTGFTGGGATVEDVLRMRRAVGDRLLVKASGGIRTWDNARALLAAGAARLGTSASVALIGTGASGPGSY